MEEPIGLHLWYGLTAMFESKLEGRTTAPEAYSRHGEAQFLPKTLWKVVRLFAEVSARGPRTRPSTAECRQVRWKKSKRRGIAASPWPIAHCVVTFCKAQAERKHASVLRDMQQLQADRDKLQALCGIGWSYRLDAEPITFHSNHNSTTTYHNFQIFQSHRL